MKNNWLISGRTTLELEKRISTQTMGRPQKSAASIVLYFEWNDDAGLDGWLGIHSGLARVLEL